MQNTYWMDWATKDMYVYSSVSRDGNMYVWRKSVSKEILFCCSITEWNESISAIARLDSGWSCWMDCAFINWIIAKRARIEHLICEFDKEGLPLDSDAQYISFPGSKIKMRKLNLFAGYA